MNQTTRVFAGVGVIALIVLGGALLLRPGSAPGVGSGPVLSPPPTATSSPSATPAAAASGSASVTLDLPASFVSPRHGYTISHPADWTATAATEPWTGAEGPEPDAAYMDKLGGVGARLVVASAPLGSQSPDRWKTAYVTRMGLDGVGECDVVPAEWPAIQIGGQPAFLDGNDCAGDNTVAAGDRFFEAVAFVDGRVYLFWLQGTVDRAYFQAVLDSVVFNAASADDSPGASPRPS